jgi:Tol biopolymer transport system component
MRRGPSGIWKIHIVSSDGGAAEQLLPGSDDEGNPTWSPDGNSLIYSGVPWLRGFAPGSTAIHRVDLRTRNVETPPGTEGLWAPRWSPDGKYLIAERYDSQHLLLYDFAAKVWRPLAMADATDSVGYTSWSRDSRYLYYNTYSQNRGNFYRVDVQRGVTERISIPGEPGGAVTLGQWFTVAPDNSLLLLRDTSIHELFALKLRLP